MKVLAFPKESDRNPYTALLYRAVESHGVEVQEFNLAGCGEAMADVFHVHWPDWFLARRNPIAVWRAYRAWTSCLRGLKRQGARIVWTAHNAEPHEQRHRWLQRRFWDEFDALQDGCICLSHASVPIVKAAHLGMHCAIAVVPHGHYRDVYPNSTDRATARRTLGLPEGAPVVVHVGMVRPYKNVPLLVRAFQGVQGDARLVVAGEVFDPGLRQEILSLPKNGRMVVTLERVRDQDLQTYFKAADLAVFPFRDILNSGSAMMALSFDVPALVPAIGSMPELQANVGADWVRTFSGELGPTEIADAIAWATGTPRAPRAPLEKLEWPEIGRQTIAFYRSVLGG